jgi:NTE family protein
MGGCASAKKATPTSASGDPFVGPTQNAEQMGPPEAFGPPTPAPPPSYGPEPIQIRPVVLVLGPGLARGFAYAGVFQALKNAKIPIGAIYGTEMGGLIGTLYAMSPNINQFEWGLLKFKEDTFKDNPSFLRKLGGKSSLSEKLENRLRQVFDTKDLNQAKIPVRVAVLSELSNIPIVLDHGNAVQVVKASMAVPGLFAPVDLEENGKSTKVVSAGSIKPFLVSEARSLGLGPVVVVDVISDSESGAVLDELKGADLVIKPDVNKIDLKDFGKKTDAAFHGKNAIIQHMHEIRQLVGMPEVNRE